MDGGYVEHQPLDIVKILQAYANGKKESEIAESMKCTPEDLRYRIRISKRRKKARSLTHLVAIAIRERVIN
jgi:DNA-binding NarL/FixJ family response regulator